MLFSGGTFQKVYLLFKKENQYVDPRGVISMPESPTESTPVRSLLMYLKQKFVSIMYLKQNFPSLQNHEIHKRSDPYDTLKERSAVA